MQSIGTLSLGGARLALKRVDKLLETVLYFPNGRFQGILNHLAAGPGKRVRPLLVLLSADLMQCAAARRPETNEAITKTAAAVELIHTASLIHDDIIDQSAFRRGMPAVHCRWGEPEAVLAGDYLMAAAFRLLGETGAAANLIPLLADAVALMCRGEARQLKRGFHWGISEQEYFHVNYLKTSQFIAACCEAGVRAAGMVGTGKTGALRRFGCKVGQAFQLIDDLLDFSTSPARLGKPVGADLKQGLATLPLIYFLRNNKSYLKLFNRINSIPPPGGLWEKFQLEICRSGALEYTYRRAVQFKQEALAALAPFPPSPALTLLKELAGRITDRDDVILLLNHC